MKTAHKQRKSSTIKVNKKTAVTKQSLLEQKLEMINPNAAGIDVASEEMWVCVPEDRAEDNIRKFGAFTDDLFAIADWFKECRVTSVAMESTGIYWIPLYQVLAERGFEVCLVNARQLKNVSGRPKTDTKSCWMSASIPCLPRRETAGNPKRTSPRRRPGPICMRSTAWI